MGFDIVIICFQNVPIHFLKCTTPTQLAISDALYFLQLKKTFLQPGPFLADKATYDLS